MQGGVQTLGDLKKKVHTLVAVGRSEGEAKAIIAALLLHGTGTDRALAISDTGRIISQENADRTLTMAQQVAQGIPLQYVIGTVWFYGLHLSVNEHVLIPRPETEEMVEKICFSLAKVPATVLDIGTGSGCIALAMKRIFPSAQVTGIDISEAAIEVAKRNAHQTELDVHFLQQDLFDLDTEIPAADLTVSNPPYITAREVTFLEPHVRDHEPYLALAVPDNDPLLFYRCITDRWYSLATSPAQLWFECDHSHANEVLELCRNYASAKVELMDDLSGNPRFVKIIR